MRNAVSSGPRSVIWLPICMSTPVTSMPGSFGGAGIDLAGARDRHAELVLGFAGGDLGVRAGIDVGIDAHRDARGPARLDREPRQQFELRLGLDVDAEDVGASAARSSASVLPTPENRILFGGNAGRQRALQLAAGHHVGAGAELCQRAQHRLVGIRLHGVADQRLLAGEGFGEHAVVALQRRGRIAIERRADGIRQFGQIDRLGVQHAVAIVEMIHGGVSRNQQRVEDERFLAAFGRFRPRIGLRRPD